MRKPNFILFITDQHRADYLGCYGHPVLRTPSIDSAAAHGTRFNRCYVASPSCMPNRASLLTGRMPSVHGVRLNGIPLSVHANTFVDLLRADGYRTGLIGKSHLQNMYDEPPMIPDRRLGSGHDELPEAFAEAMRPDDASYDQERASRWQLDKPHELDLPFYGFDFVRLCIGHADGMTGHYGHWLRQKHVDPNALQGRDNALAHDYVCPNAWRTAVPEELYSTRYIGDASERFLEHYAEAEEEAPFFLMVSFPDPHHPFTPPGRYWDLYDPADMQIPASFRPGENALPQVKWAHDRRRAGKAALDGYGILAVNEQEAREAMALTCGMIAMIDDAIGGVLATCERLGLADDTVIVFTSDHGDLLGDYGLIRKGPTHCQSLIRVALIWSDPTRTRASAVRDDLCSTLDIGPTILDRASITRFNGMQGESLFSTGSSQRPAPDSVLIEDEWQRAEAGFGYGPRSRTLVTDRYRLTMYHDQAGGELYDLSRDPHEMENRWNEGSYREIKADLFRQVAYRQMALADRSPRPTRMA